LGLFSEGFSAESHQPVSKTFKIYDDIKPMLKNMGAYIVDQVEILPQGDTPTHDKNEWTRHNRN
jgi:hypothetical protein